jgi:hypothetical protein
MHAILPFTFVKTGSDCISGLYGRMVTNRSRLKAGESLIAGGRLSTPPESV